MKKPKKIYYFAATHWDREWYKTLYEFRFKLVPVLDEVLDVLEKDSAFTRFVLDGQTSVLDDYLEIRPHNRDRLVRLIAQGRLLVGPWYTMPDEFLCSYESLTQNLLLGHRKAKAYGGDPLQYGYVCDIFGHVANFPQLLRSFGIRGALLSRGLNDETAACHFTWQSPDGSAVTTFKAPESCGYGSFYFECIAPCVVEDGYDTDRIFELAKGYVERELHRTDTPYVILMDGMDHERIHAFAPALLQRLAAYYGCEAEFAHPARMADEIGKSALPVRTGELNELGRAIAMHNMLITHTLSSRYDLKRANDDCQRQLERYAMPTAVLLRQAGGDMPLTYIAEAYRPLLENQAHDSICGCSIDEVHRDMHARFRKSLSIAKETKNLYYEHLYRAAKKTRGESTVLAVFNPLPYAYEGEITAPIDFAPDFAARSCDMVKFEQRNCFTLHDEQGEEIAYTLTCAKRGTHVRNMQGNYNVECDTHTVSFFAKLRPMGVTYFAARPSDKPYRNMHRLSTGPNSAQNEFIVLRVNTDGTAEITDRKSGRTYSHLGRLHDRGEMGDGWFHISPVSDRALSASGPAVVETVTDGCAKCVLRATAFVPLPENMTQQNGFRRRSETYTSVKIVTEYTLRKGSAAVQVRTTVYNTAKDHVLAVDFPTGTQSKTYRANQCNVFVERDCGLDKAGTQYKEADIGEKQFESIVLRQDEHGGLAFLSLGGLHEVYCPDDADATIRVTLFRAFGKTFLTDGQPDGQLQGALTFDYALLPLCGQTDAELVRTQNALAATPDCFTVSDAAMPVPAPAFMTVQGDACAYNTLLPAQDETDSAFLVRLTAYGGKATQATLNFARPVAAAEKIDSLENALTQLAVQSHTVVVPLAPYETATVKIRLR